MIHDYGLSNYNTNIPLKTVKITGKIFEQFCEINVEQVYQNNNNKKLLETNYKFPLDQKCVITDVTLKIGNKILKSMLLPKNDASDKYEKAKNEKHKALLLTKNNDGIYSMNIGNIEPNETIVINYTFIGYLTILDDGNLFVLPLNIAPRYNGKPESKIIHTDIETACTIKFFLDLEWNSTKKISSLMSLNETGCQFIKLSDTRYNIKFQSDGLLRDFNILCHIDVEDDELVSKAFYTDKDDTYLMCNLRINSKEMEISDRYMVENIFVVDCSGSMEGQKINNAIKALKLAFKSLSEPSMFSIVCFGSSYITLFPENVPYNEHNQMIALEKINKICANMGGTEMLNPIKEILQNQKNDSRQNIFLFTDGDIGDKENMCSYINDNRKDTTRIFVIGIGTDANRVLCERIANVGCGSCRMIIDSDNLERTLMNHIDLSQKDYIHSIRFDFNNSIDVQYTHQNVDYMLPDTSYSIFYKIPQNDFEKLDMIRLKYCRGSDGKAIQKQIYMSKDNQVDLKLIKTLYANQMIYNIENGHRNFKDEKEKEVELVNISLDNNIMCTQTSFVIIDNTYQVQNLDSTFSEVPHISRTSLLHDMYRLLPRTVDQLRNLNKPSINFCDIPDITQREVFSKFDRCGSGIGNHQFDKVKAQNFCDIVDVTQREIFNKTSDNVLTEHKLIDYQNYNGSFKYNPNIFVLIGSTEDEYKKIYGENPTLIEFNGYIPTYLEKLKDDKYKLIIKKLRRFLEGQSAHRE